MSLQAIIVISVIILLVHMSRNAGEKGGSKYTSSLVVPMVDL